MDYINIPLKEIGRVVTGKTPSTEISEYYNGPIMFITPTELHSNFIVNKSEKTITIDGFNSIRSNTIKGTSVMVGCIGWDMGNVALCTESCATNQQINSITDIKPEYNPLYLYYWLKTKKDYLFSISSITRTPILSKSTFEEILVPMPNKTTQDKISRVLSVIDEKIETNNRINNNLAKQIEAIYDYWFIQFNYPDANGKPYKASGGSMVYSDILKRNIPTSFSVHGLLELVNWESNSQPPKSEFVYEPKNGYVRFIQNRDYDSSDHVTYIPYKPNLSIVNKLDILIDKYGDAGATRYGIEGAFNVALGKINVHTENQLEYIRSFLSSKSIYDYLHNSCMASTRASLSEANLDPIKIPLPPVEVLDNFQTLVNGLRVSILHNIEENQKLTTLRNNLLPVLMNGQATID